jgi:predicted transcriptional regulator
VEWIRNDDPTDSAEVGARKSYRFNTVMTEMNRLVEKEIWEKKVQGRSSLYKPVLTKQDFLDSQSKELTHELIDEFGSLVVSHMLDALDQVDPFLLDKLEQKIKDPKGK